jgi:hypothetical protein
MLSKDNKIVQFCERCGKVGPPTLFKDFGPDQGSYCMCGGKVVFAIEAKCPICAIFPISNCPFCGRVNNNE